jgi:hypothetical protein
MGRRRYKSHILMFKVVDKICKFMKVYINLIKFYLIIKFYILLFCKTLLLPNNYVFAQSFIE